MRLLPRDATAAIRKHAAGAGGREVCGLVVDAGDHVEVIRCANVYEPPESGFMLDPVDSLRAHRMGEVICCYHSHPRGNGASEQDIASCNAMGVPFLIFKVATNGWDTVDPVPVWRSLVGRSWGWGEHDCVSLVMDYFEVMHCYSRDVRPDVSLEDFAAGTADGDDVLAPGFEAAGLIALRPDAELLPSDVLAFALGTKAANHLGIYVGDSAILHHMREEISAVEPLARSLRRRLVKVYRLAA